MTEDFEGALRRVHAGTRNGKTDPDDRYKNTIIAIVLSAIVLIGWQYFVGLPQMEKQKQEQAQQQAAARPAPGSRARPRSRRSPRRARPQAPGRPGAVPGQTARRAPPAVTRGGAQGFAARRHRHRQHPGLDRRSRAAASTTYRWSSFAKPSIRNRRRSCCCRRRAAPNRSMPSSAGPATAGANVKLPTSDTVWKQAGSGALAVGHPVTLTYDNGEGLRVPPHHRGRRQVPVHHQGRGGEQGRATRSPSFPMR